MLVEPGSARMRYSRRIPREEPAEVIREVWVMVTSAEQVHSRRVVAEARCLTRSNVHHCIRAMSTEEEGRSRTVQHELLIGAEYGRCCGTGAGVFRVALHAAGKCSS